MKLVILVQKNRQKNHYCCAYKVTKQEKCASTIKKKIHKNLNYTKANQNRESKICQQKYPRYVNSRKVQKMFTALCEFNKKKWNLQIQKIKTNKFDNSYKEIIE